MLSVNREKTTATCSQVRCEIEATFSLINQSMGIYITPHSRPLRRNVLDPGQAEQSSVKQLIKEREDEARGATSLLGKVRSMSFADHGECRALHGSCASGSNSQVSMGDGAVT